MIIMIMIILIMMEIIIISIMFVDANTKLFGFLTLLQLKTDKTLSQNYR